MIVSSSIAETSRFKKANKSLEKLAEQEALALEIGFFKTARYPDGKSVAQLAFENDFGTISIPSRPFFRNAIKDNSGKWVELASKQISAGKDFRTALGLVGEQARGDIIRSIDKTSTPPNSPATIARKGSSKPLVDTGIMRRSVSWRVAE